MQLDAQYYVRFCKLEEFWRTPMTGLLLGYGGKEKFNFEIPENQVIPFFLS